MLPVQASAISGQGTWETTLLGRDINLNAVSATDASAVYLYDTSINVTWLRDAGAGGTMAWAAANTWAANLITGNGTNAISDWRLPTMAPNPIFTYSTNGTTAWGLNVPASSSEMASLFYSTLGDKASISTSGVSQAGFSGLTNTGSFQNMVTGMYWLGTVQSGNSANAWIFFTTSGMQKTFAVGTYVHAMAVRTGDVLASVPEPETYAMLLMGLGVIGGIARRRKQKAVTA